MRPWKTAILVGGALMLLCSSASAYTFDDMCAPRTDHTPGDAVPKILMVIDRSRSMVTNTVDPPGDTRWKVAKDAIREATEDLEKPGACSMPGQPECDPVHFGLGWFHTDSDLVYEPAEDNAANINGWLDANTPTTGGTRTQRATEELLASTSLQDPTVPGAGVLITDGKPSWEENAEWAVEDICELRTRGTAPRDTFVVGLGDGSDEQINSFMAAAGGTGTCCLNESFPCDDEDEVDPCSLSSGELDDALDDSSTFGNSPFNTTELDSAWDCSGSIEASDGATFKQALLDIAEEFECVFPLEIPPMYPAGDGADTDPDATYVEMAHMTFGDVPLPYCESQDECGLDEELEDNFGVDSDDAEDYEDEGWFWTDDSRKFVELTPKLCDEIAGGDITEVDTQVACLCSMSGPCDFTNVMVPDGMGGMRPANATELDNMRCSSGEWQCVGGIDVCVSDKTPMPEICNGVDDDCDGRVDNMNESWEKSLFDGYSLPGDHAGIDCNQQNICRCPDGMADSVGGTDEDSFYDSWSGNCQCVEGLDQPGPASYGEPTPFTDEDAACSTGPAGGSGLLLLLLGLVGRWRWRRSQND